MANMISPTLMTKRAGSLPLDLGIRSRCLRDYVLPVRSYRPGC